MRPAGDAGGAALVAPGGKRLGLVDNLAACRGHDCFCLRSTKAELTNDSTGSPRWLVPVLRAVMIPHSDRLIEGRVSITSAA